MSHGEETTTNTYRIPIKNYSVALLPQNLCVLVVPITT